MRIALSKMRVQSKQTQIKSTQYKAQFQNKHGNFEQAFNQLG